MTYFVKIILEIVIQTSKMLFISSSNPKKSLDGFGKSSYSVSPWHDGTHIDKFLRSLRCERTISNNKEFFEVF